MPTYAQSTDGPLSVLPPIEALTETIERPLFREDRRPPTVEEEQQEVTDVESGLFTLIGWHWSKCAARRMYCSSAKARKPMAGPYFRSAPTM